MQEMGNQQLFKEIAEYSSDEIFVTDHQGYIIYVNNACEKHYGFLAEELIGEFISDLEHHLFYPSATLEVIKQKKTVEMMQKTSLGKSLYVTSIPIFNKENDLIRVISFARDSTDITNLRKRIDLLEQELSDQINHQNLEKVVQQSECMQQVFQTIDKIAHTNTPVLLTGESGVGKNVLAMKIHNHDDQELAHFWEVSCANVSDEGSDYDNFTNIVTNNEGAILFSAGETIYFDEIDALSLKAQSKLLKFLQQIKNKVRIISSTNKDIEDLIKQGKFRKELYYRLNIVTLNIPPLRDCKRDIKRFTQHFLSYFNQKYNRNITIPTIVMNAFHEYSWPGNIREMKNIIENLVITSDKNQVSFSQLPPKVRVGSVSNAMTLPDRIEHFERTLIMEAYDVYKSSYKVAQHLGISQSTAARKIKKYISESSVE